MAGPPKNLHELGKLKAAVRVRCEDCDHSVDRALTDLIAEVQEARGSTSWPEFLIALRCPKCDASGHMLRAKPVPFTAGQPRPRGFHALLINLALQILREASWRPGATPKATLDVRLALHVLRPFVATPDDLIEFWRRADDASPHPWETCRPLYVRIAAALIRAGHPVWIRNRP